MSKTCEKCIHYDICRYPLEYRAFPDTCRKYEEKRPHGEWEWQTEDKYRCTNCNANVRVEECMNEPQYDFCPKCCASMSANDRQVTGKLNSEIEKSKSEIVPDYRDGWRLRGEQE